MGIIDIALKVGGIGVTYPPLIPNGREYATFTIGSYSDAKHLP